MTEAQSTHRYAANLSEWSRRVRERDGHQCQRCGCSHDLHAHHIQPQATHRHLALYLDNGVTLCAWCHGEEHGTTKIPDVAAVRHLAVHAKQAAAKERALHRQTPCDDAQPRDIRAWRKRLGLTQQQAAEALGVSLRQYSDYERGIAGVPQTVALACAAVAYGLPPMR